MGDGHARTKGAKLSKRRTQKRPAPPIVGLDPGTTAGAAVAFYAGQCVGVECWEPSRAQSNAAQSQAARRLFEAAPGARLIYEKPHYQKGRGLHVYGALMRSIGVFCAWFPHRATGVTPSEWRRVGGVRGRDLKAAAIRAVLRWLVDMPDLDPTGKLAAAMADKNDHVAEAALIARWFRLEHPNARGLG